MKDRIGRGSMSKFIFYCVCTVYHHCALCFKFIVLQIKCEFNNSKVGLGIYGPPSADFCSIAKLESFLSQYGQLHY